MENNIPYQRFVNAGYFKCVERTAKVDNTDKMYVVTFVKQRGLDYMNGERMIVYQGACSFKFWTGKDMPIHEVKVALGMEESE